MFNFLKKDKPITLVFTPDNRIIKTLTVAIISILENTNKPVDIVIIHSELNEKSVKTLNFIKKKYKNCRILYKKADTKRLVGYTPAHWTVMSAWFRIFAPELLPNCDKLLYLDCDIILRGDISELYGIDVSKHILAGVRDVLFSDKNAQRLELKSQDYFNAGILLINCKKWREKNITDKIDKFVKANGVLEYGDQDALNKVIDEDKLVISPKYNTIENFRLNFAHEYEGQWKKDYENRKKCTLIVHFAGAKPFDPVTKSTFKDEWWIYAKKASFYTELLEEYKINSDILLYKLNNIVRVLRQKSWKL